MSRKDLEQRVDAFRMDFEAVIGKPFKHFYCPILFRDEPTELCKGHVINRKFKGSCRAWVPQRKDVDGFYGRIAESNFIAVVKDKGRNLADLWLDPAARKKHRPQLEFRGQRLEHYFTKDKEVGVGHSRVQVVAEDTDEVFNVGVKLSPEQMMATDGKTIQLVVDQDYRPAVVASVIKTAHLSMFHMLGYQYALDTTAGHFAASILREFYEATKDADDVQEKLADYFSPYMKMMVMPMAAASPDSLRGTVEDKQVIAVYGASGRMYSTGVVVRAAEDKFTVFLPTGDPETIGTYFGFLKEPPESLAVKNLRFMEADDDHPARWEGPAGDPIRVKIQRDGDG